MRLLKQERLLQNHLLLVPNLYKRIIDTLNNLPVADMSVNDKQKIQRSYGLNSDGLLVKYHRWRKEGYAKELAMVPNDYKDELLRLYHTLPHGGHLV